MQNHANIRIELDRIIVSHTPPKGLDDVSEFTDTISSALVEWSRLSKLSGSEIAGQLSRKLVERISAKAATLITPEAVLQIQGIGEGFENSISSKRLAENICDELSKFAYKELVLMSAVPARGRKRTHDVRDRAIYEARQKGLSYGKIAIARRMKKHAVQAACRREIKRRQTALQYYPKYKDLLQTLGIVLEETARPAEPNARPR